MIERLNRNDLATVPGVSLQTVNRDYRAKAFRVSGSPIGPLAGVSMIDGALNELATFDPRRAQIVEMRDFGGLNRNDIAAVLGVSTKTVNRDWSPAEAWLARRS